MRTRKIDRVVRVLKIAVGVGAATWALAATAIEPTASVIEYYNATLSQFFITASSDEAAMLDHQGWMRTGVTWNAWASRGDDPNAVPVCRFFGTPGKGPKSYFYTADANECALLKQDPSWTFDAIAFYIE